jgi:hypothetical protein
MLVTTHAEKGNKLTGSTLARGLHAVLAHRRGVPSLVLGKSLTPFRSRPRKRTSSGCHAFLKFLLSREFCEGTVI